MFNKNTYRLSKVVVPPELYLVKIGEKYNQLTVKESPVYLETLNRSRNKKVQFALCNCDCGNSIFRGCGEIIVGRVYACNTCSLTNVGNRARKGTAAKDGIKQCSQCRNFLSVDNFYQSKKRSDGYKSWCKKCSYIKCVASKFKLTKPILNKLFDKDNLYCKICNKQLTLDKTDEVIPPVRLDHNHTTNQVRDILCHYCNIGIGNFFDNPELLENAAKYLRKHSTEIC